MKIISRIQVNILLSVILAIIVIFYLYTSVQSANEMRRKEIITAKIVKGIAELKIISHEYLLYPGERSLMQWKSRYDSILKLLVKRNFNRSKEQIIIDKILINLERFNAVFTDIIKGSRNLIEHKVSKSDFSYTLQDRLIGELLIKSQATLYPVFQLNQMVQDDALAAQKRANLAISIFLSILIAYIIVNSLWIKRSIGIPIAKLKKGMEIVAKGNLDYKVGISSTDEIGMLSNAFDKMTGDLKKTTASIDILNNEIAERKQMEDKLRVSELWMRSIFNSLQETVLVVSPDRKLKNINEAAKRDFGYSEDEIFNQSTEIIHIDHEHYVEFGRLINEAFDRNESANFEFKMKRKNGEIFPTEHTVSLLKNDSGENIGIVSVIRDISERKQAEEALQESEERFRSIMEEFIDPLYIASYDFNLEYMNPAMIRLIGRDAIGETCYKAVYGLDSKCDWCNFDIIAKEESFELDIKNPVDNRDYRVSNMPIHNKNGSISKMTVMRDITNYLNAMRDKEKAQVQLLQAQKMDSIGKLAGGIAHDFNNMLSVILGYGEDLLNKLHTTDPLHQSVREIVEAGNRSVALTRQLLAFSRRQTLQPEVVDLNFIVKEVMNMLDRLLGEDIELTTLLAEGLTHVKVDPGQIEQVILNLAVNAREAMPKGGKLTIETANIELDEQYTGTHAGTTPGEYVMLSVTDSGVGMDEETRRMIFEPFFTTKEKHKGTGLGLSTVYGIVKQSGGDIWVYSELGQGTTFKIYFPQTSEMASKTKVSSEDESIDGKKEKILVVEDEAALRKLCTKILESLNYIVTSAGTGGEALLLVEENNLCPDMIITDVVMPGMSGKVLVDRLKRTIPDLGVLYMSGYTDDAIVHHGVLDPGTPFIQKPFSKASLGKMVRKVLDETKG